MAATYEPIASIVTIASQSTATFSSIPQTYTDLVVIATFTGAAGTSVATAPRFNSDSGSNYSITRLYGSGTAASSDRQTNQTNLDGWGGGGDTAYQYQIFQYSSSSVYKTVLVSSTQPGSYVSRRVALWRSTSAITSITFNAETSWAAGSTFSLYGIKAA